MKNTILSESIRIKTDALHNDYSDIQFELHDEVFALTDDWFDYDRKQRVIKLLNQRDTIDEEINLLHSQHLDEKTRTELDEMSSQYVREIQSDRNVFESKFTSADAKRLDFLSVEYMESHDELFNLLNLLILDKWDNDYLKEKIEKICDDITTINDDFVKLTE